MIHLKQRHARLARPEDLDLLCGVEFAAWGVASASRERLNERLHNPAVDTILIFSDHGEAVACAQILWVTAAIFEQCGPRWDAIVTSGGDPDGEIAYGFNLSAVPGSQGAGAGKIALEAVLGSVVHRHGAVFVAGGRLPGFHAWQNVCAPEVYAGLVKTEDAFLFVDSSRGGIAYCCPNNGHLPSRIPPHSEWSSPPKSIRGAPEHKFRFVDPFVRMVAGICCAGHGCTIHGVMSDYYLDEASCNFGLWYTWRNPFSPRGLDEEKQLTGLPSLRRVAPLAKDD